MNKDFPDKIPVFPLSGVIYFPKTNLPLNIFEKRYLDLVNDAFKTNKFMGMIQSKRKSEDIYSIGCLGKISEFEKNDDGRIIINLTGITRFEIVKEVNNQKLYREFEVKYNKFFIDTNSQKRQIIKEQEINYLFEKIKIFFKKNGLFLNWSEFQKLSLDQQINTLAMIAPVSNEEKQKLLETISLSEKSKILSEIIEFYLHEKNINKTVIQ